MFSADVVTRSLSSKLQKQSFTPSVSYNLSLVYASVELDLSVTVVDEFGEIVTGFPFEITITSSDGHPVTEIDGDKDGQIYFDGLAEGDYSVQLAPASGYIIPAAPVVATVQPKVTFERVDVSDKIVQSDTINKADEDKQFGGNNGADSGTSTLPTSNTVEFVESSSKKETKTTEKPLLDANGKPVIKYTASLSPEGFLLLANGTASSLKAVMDNGFLVGATKTATAAAAAAAHRGGFIVSPLSTTAPAAGAASSGGGTTPVTPPPTDPVVPPVEPPVEPPVDPPVEPPTPPATVTVTYDLANGVLV
ncbi:MAG: SpaA isopeptide-forming pilin-related protein, partial [Oscillospiraceae bacterium]